MRVFCLNLVIGDFCRWGFCRWGFCHVDFVIDSPVPYNNGLSKINVESDKPQTTYFLKDITDD